jgi:hypothetical protein
VRRNRQAGPTGEREAWIHLQRVRRKLEELKKLAASGTFQEFVWELNDFISCARKVTNYLRREPGRPAGFQAWVDAEVRRLGTDPRVSFFFDLRNISEKECAVVPSHSEVNIHAAGVIELADSVETELKDAETGETIAHVRYVRLDGNRVAKSTITIYKHRVSYFFDGWPTEDILAFFEHVVSDLTDLVDRAYMAFPSSFDFRIAARSVHADK